ncbi:unnamed protein product [Citrullus colocynthis]|uniref:Transmembrane protein n=1 Tax=Citrullus colocynthis TaxID=252529 RepID=A0ABP0XS43_9ROSI
MRIMFVIWNGLLKRIHFGTFIVLLSSSASIIIGLQDFSQRFYLLVFKTKLALMGVYRHDDDEGYGGNFERKLDVSKNGSKLFEFEFLSCVTMEGGGDEDADEYLKKIWKLLGQSCLWP